MKSFNKRMVGETLLECRLVKGDGMTLKEAAKILEVKTANVSHYEKGRVQPNLKILKRYRDHFGLDVNALLDSIEGEDDAL